MTTMKIINSRKLRFIEAREGEIQTKALGFVRNWWINQFKLPVMVRTRATDIPRLFAVETLEEQAK